MIHPMSQPRIETTIYSHDDPLVFSLPFDRLKAHLTMIDEEQSAKKEKREIKMFANVLYMNIC